MWWEFYGFSWFSKNLSRYQNVIIQLVTGPIFMEFWQVFVGFLYIYFFTFPNYPTVESILELGTYNFFKDKLKHSALCFTIYIFELIVWHTCARMYLSIWPTVCQHLFWPSAHCVPASVLALSPLCASIYFGTEPTVCQHLFWHWAHFVPASILALSPLWTSIYFGTEPTVFQGII